MNVAILDAACRPSNLPACRRASSLWPDQLRVTGASVSMNSVGVLMRMSSVVECSGSPLPGAGPVTRTLPVELHVVAVVAHLAAIRRQVPTSLRRAEGAGSPATRSCAPGW